MLSMPDVLMLIRRSNSSDNLYVVLAGHGSLFSALGRQSEASETSAKLMSSPNAGTNLALYLIESCIILWQGVLAANSDSDILFMPLPALANSTLLEKMRQDLQMVRFVLYVFSS